MPINLTFLLDKAAADRLNRRFQYLNLSLNRIEQIF